MNATWGGDPACLWCGDVDAELITVALTCGSRLTATWGCPLCVEREQVLPLEEHPPDSRGSLRYRPLEVERTDIEGMLAALAAAEDQMATVLAELHRQGADMHGAVRRFKDALRNTGQLVATVRQAVEEPP